MTPCIFSDQSLAFVGGIDLCYGRWDNSNHFLTDSPDTVDTSQDTSKPPLIASIPATSSRPAANEIRECIFNFFFFFLHFFCENEFSINISAGRHIMYGLKIAHDVSIAPIRALGDAV